MTATLAAAEADAEANLLREIASQLRGLRFGSVEITVHNGQVVQVERKEKFRINAPAGKQA
ncbi:sulfur starvation response protein OscA [Pseudomonas sp. MS19]|uniref:sulfur starvation response protein OscA n=1 Tax=Pseudomonas sp. MS19 TaxID=2579939 RepID=UPI00156211A8|nr:sulfur starvation response protein OscA [Pseudomonas sp. MS19]NRH26445.1 sulfur starvation response protein OscA [Pseudomonas sp. MS19]